MEPEESSIPSGGITFRQKSAIAGNGQSPWAPLGQPMFRSVWTANVVSSIGGWMQAVAATWLMTSLTTSPLLITMVQSASSLPVVLLALPAGALADIADRRLILLVSQFWMMTAAAVLTALTFSGVISPALLLSLTAALALGTALMGPAFQAVITELVPPSQLSSAVTLNSAGFNLARAVGPAIGGVILARASASYVFALNALSFLAVILVLFSWRSKARKSVLPAERFVSAMRASIRYVRYAPALQLVLLRTAAFILFGSAVWALLPLVVLRQLGRGPSAYGILLGALGTGALVGTILLPKFRARMSIEALVDCNIVLFGVITLASALTHSFALLIGVLFAGGIAWITLLSLFNVSARSVLPGWIEGRALAVYLLVFQGGTALGSVLWGAIAGRIGVERSLLWAGAGLFLNLLLVFRFSLSRVAAVNATEANRWPEPPLVDHANTRASPTLVSIQYEIDPSRREEFATFMRSLEISRRRGGALYWGLFADPLRPGVYLEEFLVESWVEHLRQHERVTADDWSLHQTIRGMQASPDLPRVAHYLAEERI
jgi:MFS family permease